MLEELNKISNTLTSIENMLRPEPVSTIIVYGRSSLLRQTLDPAINLDPKSRYEVALEKLHMCYNIANVNSSNNLFRYMVGEDVYEIIVPEGNYDYKALIKEIEQQQRANGHYEGGKPFIELTGSWNTGHTVLVIKSGCKVDFSPANSLHSIFGFQRQVYDQPYQISENLVEIDPVRSILVHCNYVNGAYYNGKPTSILYALGVKVKPGRDLVEEPNTLKYQEILPSATQIQDFELKLTDEELKLLDLRGEEIVIHCVIRKIR